MPIEQDTFMDEWTTLEALGLAETELRCLATRGNFSRDDGVSIQFCNFRQENAKQHVLLLTGWDESFLKYGDVISELVAEGFNVYTMDWRSQGLSGRLLLDPQITHVESFEDHMKDLEFFVNEVVFGTCEVEPSQLVCLAHSMGGLLSLTAAASSKGWFQRLVVCAPMLRMRAGMPHPVALKIGELMCYFGKGKEAAPGALHIDVSRPITKKLTTNKERLAKWEKIRRAFPIVACGGVSHRWVVEAIKAQDWFQEHASDVAIPVLLLEGDDDVFVCTRRPFSHLAREAKDCRRIVYPSTYHETFFEADWARSHAMKATITFLKSGEAPEEKVSVVEPPSDSSSTSPSDSGRSLSRMFQRVFGAITTAPTTASSSHAASTEGSKSVGWDTSFVSDFFKRDGQNVGWDTSFVSDLFKGDRDNRKHALFLLAAMGVAVGIGVTVALAGRRDGGAKDRGGSDGGGERMNGKDMSLPKVDVPTW